MIVLDSSAVVAMMLDEPGAEAIAARLSEEPPGGRLFSCADYVEAGAVLAGRAAGTKDQAIRDLEAFISRFAITLAPVDDQQARTALQTRLRYGRGFKSSAKLNYGDCFAYALAKAMDAPLLYVGNDFTATDVASAL